MALSERSALFEGFKCLGLVSSSVPHLVRYIRALNKKQIVTAVGRSFLVFNERLKLLETCVAHSSDIVAIASNDKLLFTAANSEIFAWKHGHKWKVKSFQGATGAIQKMLLLGDQLLAFDQASTLYIWNIANPDQAEATLPFGSSFSLTALCHPATYINKIVLGSSQGKLQLWNIAHMELVYDFPAWTDSAITVIEQSPSLDVLAIGHQSGLIVLHHLKQDVRLLTFQHEWGDVSALTFRSDPAAEKALLVSASTAVGHLSIWNLDEARLEEQISDAHHGAIVGATFISGEGLLVTNSSDNTLRVWLFDEQFVSSRRILYQREGHLAPPTKIRFYGQQGTYILSAGLDSTLRAFSIYSERLSRSLGTASFDRKQTKKKGVRREAQRGNVLAPIVEFDYGTTREEDWDNIVAIHRHTRFVTTWSFQRKRMGEHKLLPQRFLNQKDGDQDLSFVTASSVSLSSCGHFVMVGFTSGHLDRFNLQSGMHRCSYAAPGMDTAHQGVVRALGCGQLNHTLVSGGADHKLCFWRFAKGNQLGVLSLPSPVALIRMHADANLMAVALDDFRVLLVDVLTKRVVRRLAPHGGRITDMVLDGDCRRLYVASMDSVVYVWDLMAAVLVDRFRVSSPVVSLTISPSAEFLATAHVDDLAIYLWSDMSAYSSVSLRPLDMAEDSVPTLSLPTMRSDEDDNDDGQTDGQTDEDGDGQHKEAHKDMEIMDSVYKSPEQISAHLVTFSGQAVLRWRDLINLDLARKRNKPLEPIHKSKAAPFFLPTVSSLEGPKFDLNNKENQEDGQSGKRKRSALYGSDLGRMLEDAVRSQEDLGRAYRTLAELLIEWGPAQLDAQMRLLAAPPDGDRNHLALFLELVEHLMRSGLYYELANGWLSLFLKIHIDTLAGDDLLKQKLSQIGNVIEETWVPLKHQMDECLTIIKFLRNALIIS